jgi:hypothetical protein
VIRFQSSLGLKASLSTASQHAGVALMLRRDRILFIVAARGGPIPSIAN